jgi:hypothetical protein
MYHLICWGSSKAFLPAQSDQIFNTCCKPYWIEMARKQPKCALSLNDTFFEILRSPLQIIERFNSNHLSNVEST